MTVFLLMGAVMHLFLPTYLFNDIQDLIMNPEKFEYLIKKTITYLEFHSDDSAKGLVAQWQQVLRKIQEMRNQRTQK